MLPLMEMMLKSQNGEAFSQLQKQFGLNAEQAEQALGAVMPAFSAGLKRNAAAPKDFGAFMQTLSGGRHDKYIDDTNAAFSDEGAREGKSILGHLFGSKDASRAIANHAAGASGVGESVIKKMLPVIASMVMGGISKQATGQTQQFGISPQQNNAPANAMGGGILGQILGELAKGGIGNQQGRRSAPSGRGSSGNNPLGDILEQMMGGGAGRGRESGSNPIGRDNPLGQIFEEMLSGKKGGYQTPEDDYPDGNYNEPRRPRAQPQYRDEQDEFEDIGSADRYAPKRRQQHRRPQQRTNTNKRGSGLEELFGDMFETGRDVDEGYQQGVESIFDKFMKR